MWRLVARRAYVPLCRWQSAPATRKSSFLQPRKLYFHSSIPCRNYNKDKLEEQRKELDTIKNNIYQVESTLKKLAFIPGIAKVYKSLDVFTANNNKPVDPEMYRQVLEGFLKAMELGQKIVLSNEIKEKLWASLDEIKHKDELQKTNMVGVLRMIIEHADTQLIKAEARLNIEARAKDAEEKERKIREEHQAREAKKIEEELERAKAEASSIPPSSDSTPSPSESTPPSSSSSSSSSSSPLSSSDKATPPSSDSSASTTSSSTPPPVSPSTASASSTSTSSSSTSKEIPWLPWLVDINVDDLGSANFFGHLGLLWYSVVFGAALSSPKNLWHLFPGKLIRDAETALQSFAYALSESDLPTLQKMLAPKVYSYVEQTLATYKEKKIKMTLKLKSVEESFFTNVQVIHQVTTQDNEGKLVSIVPGLGPSPSELNSVLIRKKVGDAGFLFVQENDDGQNAPRDNVLDTVTRGSMTAADSIAYFTIYANCKEVFYLEDESGNIVAGSKSTVENGHTFSFYSSFANLDWKIVDLNTFNAKVADEVPLNYINPDENDLVMRDYKKRN